MYSSRKCFTLSCNNPVLGDNSFCEHCYSNIGQAETLDGAASYESPPRPFPPAGAFGGSSVPRPLPPAGAFGGFSFPRRCATAGCTYVPNPVSDFCSSCTARQRQSSAVAYPRPFEPGRCVNGHILLDGVCHTCRDQYSRAISTSPHPFMGNRPLGRRPKFYRAQFCPRGHKLDSSNHCSVCYKERINATYASQTLPSPAHVAQSLGLAQSSIKQCEICGEPFRPDQHNPSSELCNYCLAAGEVDFV